MHLPCRLYDNVNSLLRLIIYFLDYSMRNGLYWYGEYYSYEESQQMIYDGTLMLAETLDLLIAPVGWA